MEIEVLLDASDFMWHLLSSLPYTVCVVVEVFSLKTVCDYGAKQQSIFRLIPQKMNIYCHGVYIAYLCG